ncbi:hypothetical protein [Mycobacterium asiaticum]
MAEKLNYCESEGVVVIAGDHVAGAGDIGGVGVRDEVDKFFDCFLRDDV